MCHKCGLPRRVEDETADLGGCTCLGRTEFPYESQPRSRDEAIVIAVSHFLIFIELYLSQKRDAIDFAELAKNYSKALAYRAVYKVVVNV